MTTQTPQIGIAEVFGLKPARLRLAQTWLALSGDANVPPTRWGVSSLRIFKPRLSIQTWLGHKRADRRVPLYNLFNRTPTPVEQGWSVRVTQVRDFRGGKRSYDSHNGTDFAVPVGTRVTSSAAGRVIRVSNEFHRGGLKVFVDHGHGIVTSYNHLAAALIEGGELVSAGQPIALSGASGIDNIVAFPWTAPHVHYNVFLNGRHVDPYAELGGTETSLWIGGEPLPVTGHTTPSAYAPSEYDEAKLQRTIDSCRCPKLKRRLASLDTVEARAAELLFETTYFPTRFAERPTPYREQYPRRELLALPFLAADYVGAFIPD